MAIILALNDYFSCVVILCPIFLSFGLLQAVEGNLVVWANSRHFAVLSNLYSLVTDEYEEIKGKFLSRG